MQVEHLCVSRDGGESALAHLGPRTELSQQGDARIGRQGIEAELVHLRRVWQAEALRLLSV